MSNVEALKKPENTKSGIATTAATTEALEKFLSERGLDLENALRYGVSVSDGCIKIPFLRDGQAVNHKYRGIKEKKFHQDGGPQLFWNIDVLKDDSLKNEPLIITEGEFDALAAIQCGFPRVMSVPNGAPAQKESASLSYLDEVEKILLETPEIILCTDSDEAGENLRHDLSIRLGKGRCKWVKYPKGCKDLNDALRIYGEKGVQETIRRAQPMRLDGVYIMGEIPPVPYARPHSIGIPGFEKHINIRLGDFSVWTGIPGHGKTTFVNDVFNRVNHLHNFKIGIASFEQNPQLDHKRNLRTWYSGQLEKTMTDEQKAKADKWIDENFVFFVPNDDDEVSLEWVLERAAYSVLRHGVKVVVIDPWNEMDHKREAGETITEYVGFAIREFKRFAKKYHVHVAVVAHPAKMRRNEDGQYSIPSLYDISDSAHWYNKADLGVIVHRGTDGDIIRIAKSRYHTEIGTPGDVDVKFSTETGRYTVVDNQVMNGDYR